MAPAGGDPRAHRFAYPALLLGNVALAFGPWLVRLADTGPVAAGFWRLALALPFLWMLARMAGQPVHWPGKKLTFVIAIAGFFFAADLAAWHAGIRLTKLGNATFELRAKLTGEPDAISDGFGFAPRLLLSMEGLRASGLVQPGSLVEHAYKIRLPAGTSDARLKEIREEAAQKFPEAGWSIRTRSNAAPALSSNIERFSQFLTLVGLTALVVGGVGLLALLAVVAVPLLPFLLIAGLIWLGIKGTAALAAA